MPAWASFPEVLVLVRRPRRRLWSGLMEESVLLTLERLRQEINHCSRCGTCLAHCPVYRETLEEQYVGRSKVFLFKALLEGKVGPTRRFGQIFDLCLLCRSCTAACPNGVRVDLLVEAAREKYAAKEGIPLAKRLALTLLTNARAMRPALEAGHLYQRLGLEGFLRRFGFLEKAVPALASAVNYLPALPSRPLRDELPPQITVEKPRARVGYFLGCGTNYLRPATGRATLRILQANDYEVVIPEQTCCGLPFLAAGDRKKAQTLAELNVKSFLAAGVDFIVTDCASCGSTLKEYGELLNDPAVKEFTAKVRDINEFLIQQGHRSPTRKVNKKVTYHDPCHLKKAQGIWQEPRRLLEEIPGLSFREMAEADRCCGGGGTFAVAHWDIAQKVGARKAESIRKAEAEVVATACPGCALQLEASLRRSGGQAVVKHVVELLAEAYGDDEA